MLFGSSGIRGVVGQELIALAGHLGMALGEVYGWVVVGGDTRTSTPALKHAFISGLLSAGGRAYEAGTLPTPSLAYAGRKFAAGAMITASHNPPEYNGIKLWNPDGSAFGAAQRGWIEARLDSGACRVASWQRMGACQDYPSG